MPGGFGSLSALLGFLEAGTRMTHSVAAAPIWRAAGPPADGHVTCGPGELNGVVGLGGTVADGRMVPASPSLRSFIPAITKEASEAGIASVIRSPRSAWKISGGVMVQATAWPFWMKYSI